MEWFSKAFDFVKNIGSVVVNVVKKVYEVCTTDNSAVDAYDKLEKIISKRDQPTHTPSNNAPDFFGEVSKTQIEQKISEQNHKIVRHASEINELRKITSLQIELTRLRSSAELIDRSMKNVKMHASSLLVHSQNMRNINGLIDDVNDIRSGLKNVFRTINHNANLHNATLINGEGEKARKIENSDIEKIDKKDGAISQVAAYDAFDRTRELLRNEVIELSGLASKHLNDIEKLKSNAADVGGSLGGQIISFVDSQIIPVIKGAESAGLLLKSEVSRLPAAVREKSGSLVFENGSIKLEQVD